MEKIKSEQPAPYTLTEIEPLTHDTSAFRFRLPEKAALDFLPGDHLMMHANINGQDQVRPYTPSSTPADTGFFEVIIKRYPEGLMSNYIHSRKAGDEVLFAGPVTGGHFEKGLADNIAMIAGGAGITPMISIIRTVIRSDYDVGLRLIFANKTERDIILRREFADFAGRHDNFECVFTLSSPPAGWTGPSGTYCG